MTREERLMLVLCCMMVAFIGGRWVGTAETRQTIAPICYGPGTIGVQGRKK